jgi:2-polyprenyl-3-methyl-5-hydroxy-6-metoxy-1,4-benzoquinol methylase
MGEIAYVGNELDLFEQATAWKKYYGHFLMPFLGGRVLEVGAGIGGTTSILCRGTEDKWLCLEPDPQLYARLDNKIRSGQLPSCCYSLKGTTSDLPPLEKFNAILYIDVIEHIEKDKDELARAKSLLADQGYLIVLVPAHPFLYNEFDRAIGHYRRYNKRMLKAAAPGGMQLLKIKYLDSLGLIASIANKYFLKQDYPSAKQINFWNRFLVPVSKPLDFISGYATGKTLIAVWQKT